MYLVFAHLQCFPLCQRFRKFRLKFIWKGPFRFLLTRIFGITTGGGPLISVGIFRPKFVVPFLTNWYFVLIREFGRETNSGKSHSYWLARFNRKMSFRFSWKFPLISDQSVWHNGKHPWFDLLDESLLYKDICIPVETNYLLKSLMKLLCISFIKYIMNAMC